MARFGADIVLYKSDAGHLVPAAVLQYKNSSGATVDVAVASATHADIVLLNAAATKLVDVAKATSGTFANSSVDSSSGGWENGRWAVPA
jgi:hypothetical protein